MTALRSLLTGTLRADEVDLSTPTHAALEAGESSPRTGRSPVTSCSALPYPCCSWCAMAPASATNADRR
jgi:hypothetical protein